MQTNLEKLVRKNLTTFVAGRMSLREFNRWFIPAVWDIEDAPTYLREFAYKVKAELDDYDNSRSTKSELRSHLDLLVCSFQEFDTGEFSMQIRVNAEANQPVGTVRNWYRTVCKSSSANAVSFTASSPQGLPARHVQLFEPRFQVVHA